jgi:phosphoribosylformylglycinamidine synthase
VELSAESEEQRPAVQVGNPFLEKLLIEACLELVGDDGIVAVQDLGAAGLTGAATETVAHGSYGIDVDIRRVSRREQGMTPEEVMLSESQERMLIVAKRGSEQRIQRVFERWGLHSDVIGSVTDSGLVRIFDGDHLLAELPATLLSGGTPAPEPPAIDSLPPLIPETVPPPFAVPADLSSTLLAMLELPNLCSRRSIFEQYDHMVQTNTVVPPGEGAGVLRIKGTQRGLALGLGDGGAAGSVNPRLGGALAVAEACRNVSCAGALPVALTDCLNFGDPERPAIWQRMVASVEGIRDACLALDVPVISGNVSLYNESEGAPIRPTPMIGVVGVLDNAERHARAVASQGQACWLLGPPDAELAFSQYAMHVHGWMAGAPRELDLALERRVQECVRELVATGLIATATDVAEGGLASALAELAVVSGVGMDCSEFDLTTGGARADATLFGEAPSRIIVAANPAHSHEIEQVASRWNVALTRLGVCAGETIRIGGLVTVPLASAIERWATGLDRLADGSGGRNVTS